MKLKMIAVAFACGGFLVACGGGGKAACEAAEKAGADKVAECFADGTVPEAGTSLCTDAEDICNRPDYWDCVQKASEAATCNDDNTGYATDGFPDVTDCDATCST